MADEKSAEASESFAELMAQEEVACRDLKPGQKVEGQIIAMDGDSVFVNVGMKEDGVMDKKEILGPDGKPLVEINGKIEAWVVAISPGIRLSRSMKGSGTEALEEAHAAGIPVEGKVRGTCKGGYTVEVMGRTAFCPGSQMEAGSGQPEEMVGRQMDFLVSRVENHGRNIVVSRRALLERERRENLDKLLGSIKIGDTVEGRVTRFAPFGAFVELAPSVEGLVHLSELSWSRVGSPDEAVSLDDQVRVKVIAIANDSKGNTRISLSRKQAQGDPWEGITDRFSVGAIVQGKVLRLAPFGAFIEIAPGVEGLAHLSEMSWDKRINKAEEAVSEGETLQVKIKDINPESHRISLSIRDAQGDPWAGAEEKFAPGSKVTGVVESASPYGMFVSLAPGITGLLPSSAIKSARDSGKYSRLKSGDSVDLLVQKTDAAARRISLAPEDSESEEPGNDSSWKEHLKTEKASHGEGGLMFQALQKAMRQNKSKREIG